MQSDSLEYVIRPGFATDWPFIADSWVQSLRAATRESKTIPKELFFPYHHSRVGFILQEAIVKVAAPPGDELTIYGFSVVRGNAFEFVYVKTAFRKLGIAKALVGSLPEGAICTSWTRDLQEWILPKYPELAYCPFLSEMRAQNGGTSEN